VSEPHAEFLAERSGSVLGLTINRPRAANAINQAVAEALACALGEALRNDDVRAVVLSGAGERAFSAGRDLKNPQNLAPEALNLQRRRELRSYTEALLSFDKPLVAALNGTALGAGLMLALHADQVVAAEHAAIGLPEIDIGIAGFLGHALVSLAAGDGVASDLVLTGRRVPAAEALRLGLAHAVVPLERLAAEAQARASMLAAKPVATFRQTKRWILARRRAAVEAALLEYEKLEAGLLAVRAR
jgi:enoyl-CoA hydratase/carnithine racemase